MKKNILFISIFFILVNLNARENPFEITKIYEEEIAQILEEESSTDEQQFIDEYTNNKSSSQQIVYVKPRTDTVEYKNDIYTKNILPFVKISYNDNKLIIDSKHKLLKSFILPKEKKLVFDFIGKRGFYTVRKKLNLQLFEKLIIGSHKNYNFFRVVIKTTNNPSYYKTTSINKSMITISGKN